MTDKNNIHPTAIINWDKVVIGSGNTIGPYVCIGTDAQSTKDSSDGTIEIGNNNVFREFSTVHLPTKHSYLTKIGSNNFFMVGSHIAHDCVIEDNITLCNNALIAGHTHIMKGSTIGLGTTIHQFQCVGSYSMIGMNSVITKYSIISPGEIWAGNPAKYIKENTIGLERNSISKEKLDLEIQRYNELRVR
jgi:UDP-N-acetylglucosamine acyltransferase